MHKPQVLEVIGQNRDELLERRYSFPVGKLMGAVREKLKWADGKLIKETIEKQVSRLYRNCTKFPSETADSKPSVLTLTRIYMDRL